MHSPFDCFLMLSKLHLNIGKARWINATSINDPRGQWKYVCRLSQSSSNKSHSMTFTVITGSAHPPISHSDALSCLLSDFQCISGYDDPKQWARDFESNVATFNTIVKMRDKVMSVMGPKWFPLFMELEE